MEAVATQSSDAELVRAARAGSEAAFAQIVVRYEGPLRAHCRRILDPSSAEDAVQQAFMQAFVALGKAPGGDVLLRPWLYKIAHNCAVDMLRAGGSDEAPAELDDGLHGEGAQGPVASFEERERLRDVMRLLSALPHDQRRALVARELEGRSYEEISDELGATQGGVRQLIFRARSTLRSAAAALSPWPLREWLAAARPDTVRDALLVMEHARAARVAPALAALAAVAGGGGAADGPSSAHTPAARPMVVAAPADAGGHASAARRDARPARKVRVRPARTRVVATAPSAVSRTGAGPRRSTRTQDPRGVPRRVDALGGRDALPEGAPRIRAGGDPVPPAAPAPAAPAPASAAAPTVAEASPVAAGEPAVVPEAVAPDPIAPGPKPIAAEDGAPVGSEPGSPAGAG